jgi:Leucine-rich repeat (LRR) protein
MNCNQPTPLPTTTASDEQYFEALPPTVQQLLAAQTKSQAALIELSSRKKLPNLPSAADYWQDLHYNALIAGSQRSLRKHYRGISAPKRQLTKHLDLSYQGIQFLPDHICRYNDLRYLSLSNNRLQAINPKLQNCQRLRKIDLSSNGIKHLPQGLAYLHQIEELVLADNELYTLPNFLSNLHNLKVLDISNLHSSAASYYNNIRQFPTVITKMPRLQKLFLEKLPLYTLPRYLGYLRELQVVSLNGCRGLNLAQSFESLSTLPNLVALDISFLGRNSLPAAIRKLQQLKVLIWHEEGQRNRAFIEQTLRYWLPNTKIYYGKAKVATPFLRGNSLSVIRGLGK